jgi:hypothetical protein
VYTGDSLSCEKSASRHLQERHLIVFFNKVPPIFHVVKKGTRQPTCALLYVLVVSYTTFIDLSSGDQHQLDSTTLPPAHHCWTPDFRDLPWDSLGRFTDPSSDQPPLASTTYPPDHHRWTPCLGGLPWDSLGRFTHPSSDQPPLASTTLPPACAPPLDSRSKGSPMWLNIQLSLKQTVT